MDTLIISFLLSNPAIMKKTKASIAKAILYVARRVNNKNITKKTHLKLDIETVYARIKKKTVNSNKKMVGTG